MTCCGMVRDNLPQLEAVYRKELAAEKARESRAQRTASLRAQLSNLLLMWEIAPARRSVRYLARPAQP